MMNRAEQKRQELVQVLDRLVKVYRLLLETVRREKEHLITAQIEELSKNNHTKDLSLRKAHALERERQKVVGELMRELRLKPNTEKGQGTTLLELATHFAGPEGEELRSKHAVLELIMKRLTEHNKENEALALSALKSVTGAMDSIRDTLQEKVTYQRPAYGAGDKKNTAQKNSHSSGQLVRKQV